jgi:transposase
VPETKRVDRAEGGIEAEGISKEIPMLPLLKRHQILVLIGAGHSQNEAAELAKVSVRSVKRVATETAVHHVDDAAQRRQRAIGRPSKVEAYREHVAGVLQKEPHLMSLEILRRAKLQGYDGGKSAMYQLVAQLRHRDVEVLMRFEGLPGEFSQHDFGQVEVTYLDGSKQRVRFFGSRLKWSRWVVVTLVTDEGTETLVRCLADDFAAFGGVALCAVFDRPKTVALKWGKDGQVTEWNSTFAYAALELGFTAEVCWP